MEFRPQARIFSAKSHARIIVEQVARERNIERSIRYGDEVTRCEFADGRWHLTTASGEEIEVGDIIVVPEPEHWGALTDRVQDEIAGSEFLEIQTVDFVEARWVWNQRL